MGIFGNSPLEQKIDRVTSDKNTSEDWSVILDVCDRVKESSEGPKECVRAIKSKLSNDNPRVSLQALTLLDACVNNCGHKFLLEVASREFEQELRKFITSTRTHKKVADKLRQCLKAWAEGEFKNDRQLALIPDLYKKLKHEGFDFSNSDAAAKKKSPEYSTDPNVVNNKQEEDDIAQAIQLSLQTSRPSASHGPSAANNSLYGDLSNDLAQGFDTAMTLSDSKGAASSTEVRKARALYDFEAAEDNELTFKAGELMVVLDSSDSNWWKGSNQMGEGLFPANFVTLDIHDEQEEEQHVSRSEKRVSFSESVKVTELTDEEVIPKEEVTGEIDESKVDYLLHLLHESDPTGERPDPSNLPNIEDQVNAMAPTIDNELEQIDRRHNELSRLNNDLMNGLELYHQLMREMPVGYYPPPAPAPTSHLPRMYGSPHVPPHGVAYPPMYMPGHSGDGQGSPLHHPYGAMPPQAAYGAHPSNSHLPPGPPQGSMMPPPPHGAMPPQGQGGIPPSLHGAMPPQGGMPLPPNGGAMAPPSSMNGGALAMHQTPPMMMHQPPRESLNDVSSSHNQGGIYHPPPPPSTAGQHHPQHMMYTPTQGQPL